MRDYSNRLISLSWHFLTPDECQKRAVADIEPDQRFCDMRAEPGDGEYFDPAVDHFQQLAGPRGELLDCLQIDLLRPTYDYLSLKYNSLLYLLMRAERALDGALETRGIETEWSKIYTTTQDDSPVSAYRRSIIFPNLGFDGTKIANQPRSADLPVELLAQLEDDLESHFRDRMWRKHYA